MLASIRLTSRLASAAGPLRQAAAVSAASGYAGILANSVRHFADKPLGKGKGTGKNSKPESLLNDDILAKAGMDMSGSERVKAPGAGEQAPGAESNAQASSEADPIHENSEESEHREWAKTARKPRTETTTLEKRTRRGFVFALLCAGGAAAFGLYSARPFDDDEKKKNPDIESTAMDPAALWARAKARTIGSVNYFVEPAFDKVLPDPLPAPYGRPLTLVLALDDLLVKSQWSREHGWRTAKRPGLDYFLVYLAQYYEVVIFSDKYQPFDEEVVAKLDPYRAAISYSLFRESSRFKDGKIIKDLSHLNRDLSKVVVVDVSPDAVSMQPENALILPRWKGNADDSDLVRLIPFLEWIGAQPIKDVRPILQSITEGAKKDDVGVLDEFERRERLARERWQKTHKGGSGGGSWASSLLGVSSKQDPNTMPQDYVRAEGQKSYAQFQKLIEEQGQKMLEEEKEREKQLMDRHKMTINKYMTQGGPSQEDIQATMAEMEAEARHTATAQEAARHEKVN